MNSCPHCGERVEEADAFCFECGTKLHDDGGPPDRGADEHADRVPPGTPREQRDRTAGDRRVEHSPRTRTAAQPGERGYGEGDRREYARGDPYERPTADKAAQVYSLTTLWIALAAGVLGALENLGVLLFADELADQMAELGFGDEITAQAIAIQGGLGLLVSFAIIGLCVYYYRQGALDRRFYWALIATGVLGFIVGAALSFLVPIVVGAYGLLVGLKRASGQDTAPASEPS